ncbi:MAG: hypothetical protein ABFD92_20955 [Planctomycetaceae bacterium]
MDLNDSVKYLAQARKEAADVRAEVEAAQAALEATTEWTTLQTEKARLARYALAESEADANLRELARSVYENSDGNKHPHPAVTVKLFDVLVYDPGQAKSYAIAHLPNALKLDARAFEKAARVLGLDFVTIVTDARATIATDLSEWVA